MALYPYTGTAGLASAGELPSIYDLGYDGSTALDSFIETKVGEGIDGIFFPPGTYTFTAGMSIWDTFLGAAIDVEFRGVAGKSKLVVDASNTNGRLFNLRAASGVIFRDLTFVGRGVFSPGDGADECAIFATDSERLTIENCRFTEFSGFCVHLMAQNGARIVNNWFYDNHNPGDATNSGDIQVNTTAAGGQEDIIITGNHCNSNNKVGISLNKWGKSVVVSNNMVVSRCRNGLEPTDSFAAVYDPDGMDFRRKDAIMLCYGQQTHPPEDPFSVVCSGNVIRNARWSGIYLNDSEDDDVFRIGNGGNFTIADNVIERVLMDTTDGNHLLQAGIQVTSHQATVTGNIIKDVNLFGYSQPGVPSYVPASARGIRLRTWDTKDFRTITSVDTANDWFNSVGHQFNLNDVVVLDSTGTLPPATPTLAEGTRYWIVAVEADRFKLSASYGGSVINISGSGTGTLTAQQILPTDAIVVSGNIVENVVDGHGIDLERCRFPVIITGNTVTNAEYRQMLITGEEENNGDAEIVISGNILRKTRYLDRSLYLLQIVPLTNNTSRRGMRVVLTNNQFVIAGDILSSTKDLVYVGCDHAVIANNLFKGTGTHDNGGKGMEINATLLAESSGLVVRRDTIALSGNKFVNLNVGITVTTNATTQHTGPIVDQGSVYENVGTRYSGSAIMPGQIAGNNVVIRATGRPPIGTFRQGDIWLDTDIAAGARMGEMCIIGGTVGTWRDLPSIA